MHRLLDLDRYPLHDLMGAPSRALMNTCRRDLEARGMFNLEGFLRPGALSQCMDELRPRIDGAAFTLRRSHNIYFEDDIAGRPMGFVPSLTNSAALRPKMPSCPA